MRAWWEKCVEPIDRPHSVTPTEYKQVLVEMGKKAKDTDEKKLERKIERRRKERKQRPGNIKKKSINVEGVNGTKRRKRPHGKE